MPRIHINCVGLLVALLLIVSGPSRSESGEEIVADEGFEIVNPGSHDDDRIRILISHDMEGLSGQTDWRTYSAAYPEHFRRGQRLLAADVNAVIEGLFEGGADAVDVFDQHGSGQPDSIPDIPPDLLHPRARQVFLNEGITPEMAKAGNYDALVTVGEHCKTGSGGFAAHTVSLGIELVANGKTITEVELKALQWGQFGVPLIFSSGDDRLAHDLEHFPWIEYVTVKYSTSAAAAELRPVDQVHAEMRQKARRAVERLPQAMAVRLRSPVRFTVRAVYPASLEIADKLPSLHHTNDSISFVAPALDRAALESILAIVSLASQSGRSRLLQETLGDSETGRDLLSSAVESYWLRWMAQESGLPPP